MKVLIVKTSSIGDVIQTFPVAEYLASKGAEIDWVVERESADLLRAHPLIRRVIELDTRAWRRQLLGSLSPIGEFIRAVRQVSYDVVFDLQGNSKSALIVSCVRGKEKVGFAMGDVAEWPNLLVTNVKYPATGETVRSRYLGLVQSHFRDAQPFEPKGVSLYAQTLPELPEGRPLLMVAFGSKWANKRLSEETLEAFLNGIARAIDPTFVFIWGGQEERRIADHLHATFPKSASIGNLTLPRWQALMGKMDGVIAMDSAALHLAETAGVPSFSVFGPSSAAYYRPLDTAKHMAIQGACPYNMTFEKRCKILRTCPTGACIHSLSPSHLASHFTLWWQAISHTYQGRG
jgi:heptosyltransferase-1